MTEEQLTLLHTVQKDLYAIYETDIRDCLIFIESTYHKFPIPFLNEIRAAQDHISRCFSHQETDPEWEVFVKGQIKKARSHYDRCLLDCYKYIWYRYGNRIFWAHLVPKCFGKLQDIDNGEFYKEYRHLYREAKEFNNKARKLETSDKEKAKECFRDAIGCLKQMDNLFEENYDKIGWSVAKGFAWRLIWATGWIISGIYFFARNWDPIANVISWIIQSF